MKRFQYIPVPMTPIDQDNWMIEEQFDYFSSIWPRRITVPVAFTTDFASVPRVLWWLYPRWGKYGFAAIVHDYLYRRTPKNMSRLIADRVFFEAMIELGVPRHRALIMFYGVRLGGWVPWGRWRRGYETPADES